MKLSIFYTVNTPADRDIAFLRRRLGEIGVTAELIDADSRSGSELAQLYDVMQRPAVVITGTDGQLVYKWQGELPRLEDVALYVTAR